ncbi:AAA-like domain-containing protein [Lyngbya sp. CCY1209]|uniref:AAA-like domain-containing protein n=1 Tax=Lyngbya sp. CCY1209 TaxID=2886103 RepID=UPI002D20CB8B|nr:AAA-like domain-containing protein [Lyngbya sp. CCY1209]MEB3884257.1 AAA-like domain-containing protein [Lyngbya sp. CCY1209]
MNLSYYQVGGSLRNDAPCYVERAADTQLYEALKRGEFCYLLNARQMGKSSLLVRTSHRLRQEGYLCATLDMTVIGNQDITPQQWYKGIVAALWQKLKLIRKLNLKSWWAEREERPFVQRCGEFIEEILGQFPDQKIVIFIDEIDNVLKLDFSADDFFALIRFCYNQRALNPEYDRITFAIFGVATPSDLIRDGCAIANRTRTPFNIGTAIALHGFTPEEAEPLARGLSPRSEVGRSLLREILKWTSGQPFLTQKLCKILTTIVAKKSKNFITENFDFPPFWIDSVVRNEIVESWEARDEPEHLRTIRNRLFSDSNKVGRLLGIYQKIVRGEAVKSDDSREQIELRLSGLVAVNGNYLQVKNRIYEAVFNSDWVRRQLDDIRPYSQALEAWTASGQSDRSRLLRGRALQDAHRWAQGKSLGDLDYQFLAASVECDRREVQLFLEAKRTQEIEARLKQEQQTAKFQRLFLFALATAFSVAIVLGILLYWQYLRAVEEAQKAKINEIKALSLSAEKLLFSPHHLEALLGAIEAKIKLNGVETPVELRGQVDAILGKAIFDPTMPFNHFSAHEGVVTAIDISPDSRTIATGGYDKIARLWKRNGELLQTLDHDASIYSLRFTPDGKTLVTSTQKGTIYFWQPDGRLLRTIPAHDSGIWTVAIAPDGETIASAGEDKTVKIWNRRGENLRTLEGVEAVGLAFSFGGDKIALGTREGELQIRTSGGQLLHTVPVHRDAIKDVAFVEWPEEGGGTREAIVSGSRDGAVKFWDGEGRLLQTLPEPGREVYRIAVGGGGTWIAARYENGTVNLWKTPGLLWQQFQSSQSTPQALAFSPDGRFLALAADGGTVKLVPLLHPLLTVLPGHEARVWGVSFGPDGKTLASGSADETLRMWAADGSSVQIWPQGVGTVKPQFFTPKMETEFLPRRPLLATGTSGGGIRFLDAKTGELVRELPAVHRSWSSVAVSPDGGAIASWSHDQTIKLWNLRGELERTLRGHGGGIYKVLFSPDGKKIASVSQDHTLKIWESDGTLLHDIPAHDNAISGLSISSDGTKIATASLDDTLKIWNFDGQLLRAIATGSGGSLSVAFSPDGDLIATGGMDGNLSLWKADGTKLITLIHHEGVIFDVEFSPDGRRLASAGDDGAIALWNVEKLRDFDPLNFACGWIRDYLNYSDRVESEKRSLCDRAEEK